MVHVPIDVILKNEKEEELHPKDRILNLQKNIQKTIPVTQGREEFLTQDRENTNHTGKERDQATLKIHNLHVNIIFKVKGQATFWEKIISHKRSSQKGSTQEKLGHHKALKHRKAAGTPPKADRPHTAHAPPHFSGDPRQGWEPPREGAPSSTRSLCQVPLDKEVAPSAQKG